MTHLEMRAYSLCIEMLETTSTGTTYDRIH